MLSSLGLPNRGKGWIRQGTIARHYFKVNSASCGKSQKPGPHFELDRQSFFCCPACLFGRPFGLTSSSFVGTLSRRMAWEFRGPLQLQLQLLTSTRTKLTSRSVIVQAFVAAGSCDGACTGDATTGWLNNSGFSCCCCC